MWSMSRIVRTRTPFKNSISIDDKLINCKNVYKFCKHLSTLSKENQKISEFESVINSEKLKAKKYFIIQDNCNVLSKLNKDNVSLLLDTGVDRIHKWVFKNNNCALVELEDDKYLMKHDVRRRLGFESRRSLQVINNSRFFALNDYPQLVTNKRTVSANNGGDNGAIERLTSKRRDIFLDVDYLRTTFKTNKELIACLLNGKCISDLDLKLRFYIINQLETMICQSFFRHHRILPFGSTIAGISSLLRSCNWIRFDVRFGFGFQWLGSGHDSECLERIAVQIWRSSANRIQPEPNRWSLAVISAFLFSIFPNTESKNSYNQIHIRFGASWHRFVDRVVSTFCSSRGLYVRLHQPLPSVEPTNQRPNKSAEDLGQSAQYASNELIFNKLIQFLSELLKPRNWSPNMVYNGFTSFQLTALVLFFLQKKAIIPPMKYFLNDKPFEPSNRETNLIELMSEFFEFVISHPFDWEALSILEASTFENPDDSPIYMENPFDLDRNMCQNVIKSKFQMFLELSAFSAGIMRSQDFCLADIFDSMANTHKNHNRIIVKDLFSE